MAAKNLFCPNCGTLGLINWDGLFECPDYRCRQNTTTTIKKRRQFTSTSTRDFDSDKEAKSGSEAPSMENKSYKKNCYSCGKAIWIQYREETDDYIPLDFGNGGKMKPHDCQ